MRNRPPGHRIPRWTKRLNQTGLALLDVLLGMAIFALIAVIAVQSMGQFRDRGYMTQAVSDARQVGTGVVAHLTAPGAGLDDVPVGLLDAASQEALGVNLTDGNSAYVAESLTVDGFDVCVQNESAYAVWRADSGAIKETGTVPADGDCTSILATLPAPGPGGPGDGDGDDDDDPIVGAYPPCDMGAPPALMAAPYMGSGSEGEFPGLTGLGLSEGDWFHPYQTGFSEAEWEEKRSWYTTLWYTAEDVDQFHFNTEYGVFFIDPAMTIMATDLVGGGCDFSAVSPPPGDGSGPGEPPAPAENRSCDVNIGAEVKMPRYSAAAHGSIPELNGLSDGEYFMPWRHFDSSADFGSAVSAHRGTFWDGLDQRVLTDYIHNWDSATDQDDTLNINQASGVLYEDDQFQNLFQFYWGTADMVESPAGSGYWVCADPGVG